mgnify:CR=1 FL=1
MKVIFTKKYLIHILFLVLLLVAGCSGPKTSKAPELTEGLAAAMVPNMPLDGYLFVRQSQPIIVPLTLLGAPAGVPIPGLPSGITIQSVEIWILPNESTEIIGAVVTFPSAQDASNLFSLIPNRNELWKYLAANNIFFVMGSGSGAEALKNAITARQFVSLATAAPDAWDLMQRFPGQPATKPLAVGFVRMEDRLFAFIQKYAKGSFNEGTVSALKMAKVEMAAVAMYSNKVLQATDLLSPANLKNAGLGGIMIAKSSYPGFAISAALGPLASRLSLDKTDIDGKSAYYRAMDVPGGEKVHLLFNNSGQYIYAAASANLERTQQLYRWVWGQ